MAQLRALDSLDGETQLVRRPTVLAELVQENDDVSLVFEGRELTFPDHAAEELQAIFESDEPFTAADLPGSLDEAGRLVLVRRLVREGFLELSAA
jgi:hypothetical protein